MLNAPCSVTSGPLNTGLDCQVKMFAPAMFIIMLATDKWTSTNEQSFLAYINTRCHDVVSKRWRPLFGYAAPVRVINDGKESDVIVTYDDGSQAFIRNGTITRTLMTNKGGLAYAAALRSFNKFNNLAFIEIDKFNNVLRKQNADGTFSGIPLNMAYAPTPDNSTLKDEFKPAFSINYTADDYISKGVISSSDEDLLSSVGLINVQLTAVAGSTTTSLKFGISTIGTLTDLVAAYPQLASLTAFTFTNAGVTITPSAITIVSGVMTVTVGAQASGSKVIVSGAGPASWLALTPPVSGYDVTVPLTITIS